MKTPTSPVFQFAQLLAILIVPLTAIAAAGGLFIDHFYRDPAAVTPAMQAQDVVTLLTLPVLVVVLLYVRRGSTRATLVWVGLLGYVFYTYTGAAFGYHYNPFFLLYVGLFSLSVFTLIAAISSLNVDEIQRTFDQAVPRLPIVIFMIVVGVMLAALELGENISYLGTGTIPKAVMNAGGITFYPYVLDLGLIVPLTLLTAIWLSRRTAWGYILTSYMLIKGTTMGLALLAGDYFLLKTGQMSDGLELFYLALAVGGIGLTFWFFRHCHT